jgi:hypothetical protein
MSWTEQVVSRLLGGLVFVVLVVPVGLLRRLARPGARRSWRDGDTTRRPVDPSTMRLTRLSGGQR